jgi:hypothetical protein
MFPILFAAYLPPSKEGFAMRTRRFHFSGMGWQTYILIGLTLFLFPSGGFSQNVRAREEIAQILPIENLTVSPDDAASGEVVNRSRSIMRDVQILIRHEWLWANEFKPGKDDPSRATYVTLPQEIPPGGRLPFSYKPSPPLPKAAGGRFITSVAIAGLTEVTSATR